MSPDQTTEDIRRATLAELAILDSAPEREYDAIARAAQRLFGCASAYISLIDGERQWFKARQGFAPDEVPRAGSICALAVEQDREIVSGDMQTDGEWREHPTVRAMPGLRFYASLPLRGPALDGTRVPVGSLCVFDGDARDPGEAELAELRDLARVVETLFETRVASRRAGERAAERIEAIEQLEARNRQFEMAERMAGVGSWRLDLETSAVEWSKQTQRIHGLENPSQEVLASALDYYPPHDRVRIEEAVAECIAQGTPYDLELDFLNAQQRERRVRAMGERETQDGRSVALIGVFQDVTERVEAARDLEDARDAAEAAVRAKSAFLANMSHEIRTPMNGVIGFTELLLQSPLDPAQRKFAEAVAESSAAMMGILNDILEISKIEAGKLELDPQPVDIRALVGTCVQNFEAIAIANDIELGLDAAPEVPQFLLADPLRLRQVLLNLIGNAVKFTKDGEVSVVLRTENGPSGDTLLAIEVADTGIGIAPEKQSEIFAEFGQASAGIAQQFGGTGLGLAIASRLVGLMDGTIALDSRPGEGSTFTIALPITNAVAPAAEPDAGDPRMLLSSKTVRVLFAEDHDINQLLIMEIARELKLAAELAENGLEAARMVEEAAARGEPYDIVFMDLRMPECDGLDATRRIRAAGHDDETLPIVALTANCYAEDVRACLEAGMQAHLAKPVKIDELARAIAEHVEQPAITEGIQPVADAGLTTMYRERKRRVLDTMRDASISGDPSQVDWTELVRQLHQLAGTAAFFGEARFGDRARELGRKISARSDPDECLWVLRHASNRLSEAA